MIHCCDCNKKLNKIHYVRRLRPGQQRDSIEPRDPLCKECWRADNGRVEASPRREE